MIVINLIVVTIVIIAILCIIDYFYKSKKAILIEHIPIETNVDNQPEIVLSEEEKTRCEIEKSAQAEIELLANEDRLNFFFNGIYYVGKLYHEYFYVLFEKSHFVGEYAILFSTTNDYHNVENNMIPQATLKTAQQLDSIIYNIKHTYKIASFPIMPFQASTIKEVKDKVEIELLGKAEYKDFVYSPRFDKEDDEIIETVTLSLEQ